MTNFIPTDQIRSLCSENPALSSAICTNDRHCQNRPFMLNINGRWTGRCLFPSNSTNQTGQITGLCEIQGE